MDQNEKSRMLQILAGCDVNTRASEDVTALHMAAAANRSSHVTILLENGANPNAVNARLETRKRLSYFITFKYFHKVD